VKLPAAIAFDLDGTLVDSRGDIAAACNHTLAWAGRAPLPESTVATFVGDGARALLARAFGLPRESSELDPLLAEWTRFYSAHPVDHTTWMPGAERALRELPARGVRLALVTNKSRVVTLAILDALGVASRFGAVYAGGDGPLKPSPEPVARVSAALGLAPADLWVVGDAAQDIGAARAAGARAVGILGGFHPEARLRGAEPDAVYPTIDALLDAMGISQEDEKTGRI
jgi:2-phosphoglycolate phosphatase